MCTVYVFNASPVFLAYQLQRVELVTNFRLNETIFLSSIKFLEFYTRFFFSLFYIIFNISDSDLSNISHIALRFVKGNRYASFSNVLRTIATIELVSVRLSIVRTHFQVQTMEPRRKLINRIHLYKQFVYVGKMNSSVLNQMRE